MAYISNLVIIMNREEWISIFYAKIYNACITDQFYTFASLYLVFILAFD